MSECGICGAVNDKYPAEWDRECSLCFTDDLKETDGTLTPAEKRVEYRRRVKWMRKYG